MADPHGPDRTGGAAPTTWLGAPAPGGLALPDASPTATNLYGPRGVWLDDRCTIVADTGNHRVLIWHDAHDRTSHRPADVVLGQADFTAEGPNAAGTDAVRGLHLPTGVLVDPDGRLWIADAWNHRLLAWDQVPTSSFTRPDVVVGQARPDAVDPNGGGDCGPDVFYWPFGMAVIDGDLWVADTGNRRVLRFDGLPDPGALPTVVVGQPDPTSRDENGGGIGPSSFRWPHAIAGTADDLYVADAGNHRLLSWQPAPIADTPADRVFGQPDFTTALELPYAPQSPTTLRFPYSVVTAAHGAQADGSGRAGPAMAVADTANNRVLWWRDAPQASNAPADGVLGQYDFAAVGENRWDLVAPDTLCWPYGLALHDGRLAVADSGNNRVVVWEFPS